MIACVARQPKRGELARAHEKISVLFLGLRDTFTRRGLARLRQVELRVERLTKTGRHFASCGQDGLGVNVAVQSKLVLLPEEQQIGILAHELGHAMDFLYPAELDTDGGMLVVGDATVAQLADWQRRGRDRVERDADRFASALLGVPIGYTGSCMLQTVGRGRKRPGGLR